MSDGQMDYHALFEHAYTYAPIGIALEATDGTFIKVNDALCEILGYPAEEWSKMTFHEITHPHDMDQGIQQAKLLLDGTLTSYQTEKRYFHKKGHVVWISLYVSLVRDEVFPLYYINHLIDISEKKTAEMKLLEIEESYRLISENVQDIIAYSSPDGIIQYCSPSIQDILGFTPEEFIGKTNIEIYHPEDIKRLKSIELSDHEIVTYRARHKNGKYLWMETNFKILRDAAGNAVKTVSIGRDITERKKNEDHLAESQRIAMLGSWEWDLINKEVTFSEQLYRIYDLEINESTKAVLDLVHPKDHLRLMEGINQALLGKEFTLEYRVIQSDATYKYLQIHGLGYLDEHGNAFRMTGTVQDITERKQIEIQLQESIERYTSLKKYNHDAVISLDLAGNIIGANQRAHELTGYDLSEMIGINFSMFIESNNVKKIVTQHLEKHQFESDINKIGHKDGKMIEVITSIAPIIINNEKVGFYIIIKDITEQKKLIIAKEEAENTNKAKSEFLAMMSHEIRTPLNGVIGIADLLSETKLDTEQKDYVNLIRKSGDSLISIINEILDFSKIEFDKMELMEEPIDIHECVAVTIDLLSPIAKEKRLTVAYLVDPKVPGNLIGDHMRFKQVLMNLIGNAIKYTISGGVTVTVSMIAHQLNSVELECRVQDSGIGIPKDKVIHLFEPFSQLATYINRNVGGTGLGLAISKKLVKLMNGDINVVESDEPGTTFIFTVIFKKNPNVIVTADATQPEKEERLKLAKTLNILIAEDHEINQLVLRKMVEKSGHCVDIVNNGVEAVEAITHKKYDLVFMDIQMPKLNGLEAVKVIKEKLLVDKCPIIVAVSANAFKSDRDASLAAGMDDYLSKPIKKEMVEGIIVKYFEALI